MVVFLLLKELSEAENQFKRILEFYPNEGLDSLAYCGIGKVYLKKNRLVEMTLNSKLIIHLKSGVIIIHILELLCYLMCGTLF